MCFQSERFNPLTTGPDYVFFLIFYDHIKYFFFENSE